MKNLFRCTIETSILIDAPIDSVWKELTDFKEYPAWNPLLKSVTGTLKVNEQLKVVLHPAGASENIFYPRLTKITAPTALAWVGKLADYGMFNLGFLFTGTHYFNLEQREGNKTFLQHGELLSGALIPVLRRQLETVFQSGFAAMNSALKERCEKTIAK